ncbi:hypothetical protein BIW11_10675 [Tropilaelaps mercedesae]|uniref:Uncharacterized protein n=1 Tax=Tropilaelaps mercedesae TaxID=418985 RepID=A0A1V9XEV3_9ACAR|nr:hypothetical protein BIW11_10675 [Tropilaelaps mercedesae]
MVVVRGVTTSDWPTFSFLCGLWSYRVCVLVVVVLAWSSRSVNSVEQQQQQQHRVQLSGSARAQRTPSTITVATTKTNAVPPVEVWSIVSLLRSSQGESEIISRRVTTLQIRGTGLSKPQPGTKKYVSVRHKQ